MPMPKMNLIGMRYGKLTVVSDYPSDKRQQSRFVCECDCGNTNVVLGRVLKSGDAKSCGCLRIEEGRKAGLKSAKHGMLRTPTYRSWQAMKDRCLNKNSPNTKWYGEKGVKICDSWLTFEGFLADMGERPEGTTLDRINPFGDYEPENCRWADEATQKANTRKSYERAQCLQ